MATSIPDNVKKAIFDQSMTETFRGLFPGLKELADWQRQAITALVTHNRDTVLYLPCGAGKTLLVQMLAAMLPADKAVLYVAPLQVLIKQTIDEANKRGIRAAHVSDAAAWNQMPQLIVLSMEELTKARKKILRNSTFWQSLIAIVVLDEAHLYELWEHFREVLSEVYYLRSTFRNNPAILLNTGSPTPEFRERVAVKFSLRPNPLVISRCLLPQRLNLRVLTSAGANNWAQDLDVAFHALDIDLSRINSPREMPQLAIFCRDHSTAVTIATEYPPFKRLLYNKQPAAGFTSRSISALHGLNSSHMQVEFAKWMHAEELRAAAVTQVLLAGFNTAMLKHIIILGASSLSRTDGRMPALVQMMARGGMRGIPVDDPRRRAPGGACQCLLFLSKSVMDNKTVKTDTHFCTFLKSISSGVCMRQAFSALLKCCDSHEPVENCCDACDKQQSSPYSLFPNTFKPLSKVVSPCAAAVEQPLPEPAVEVEEERSQPAPIVPTTAVPGEGAACEEELAEAEDVENDAGEDRAARAEEEQLQKNLLEAEDEEEEEEAGRQSFRERRAKLIADKLVVLAAAELETVKAKWNEAHEEKLKKAQAAVGPAGRGARATEAALRAVQEEVAPEALPEQVSKRLRKEATAEVDSMLAVEREHAAAAVAKKRAERAAKINDLKRAKEERATARMLRAAAAAKSKADAQARKRAAATAVSAPSRGTAGRAAGRMLPAGRAGYDADLPQRLAAVVGQLAWMDRVWYTPTHISWLCANPLPDAVLGNVQQLRDHLVAADRKLWFSYATRDSILQLVAAACQASRLAAAAPAPGTALPQAALPQQSVVSSGSVGITPRPAKRRGPGPVGRAGGHAAPAPVAASAPAASSPVSPPPAKRQREARRSRSCK